MKRLSFVLGATLALLASSTAFSADDQPSSRVPLPKVSITKLGEKCVEPTDIMRRDHMKYIMHQRDMTMRDGIRTTQHSLKNCVNCHADPQTGSVLGKDGFCASCHTYAAVHVDCFACHTDKAEKQTSAIAPAAGHEAGR